MDWQLVYDEDDDDYGDDGEIQSTDDEGTKQWVTTTTWSGIASIVPNDFGGSIRTSLMNFYQILAEEEAKLN